MLDFLEEKMSFFEWFDDRKIVVIAVAAIVIIAEIHHNMDPKVLGQVIDKGFLALGSLATGMGLGYQMAKREKKNEAK